jgi:signal peptidase II
MQAARGASLSSLGELRPTPRSAVGLFAAVTICALAVDQVTKVLAVRFLEGESSVQIIPGLIQLTFLRNGGAALGTGSSMTIVLTVIAVAVSIAVLRIATRLRDRWWAVGLGLLLAGAVGNLVDRLLREPAPLRGHVVDFIDYGPFVGNVADIALTFAAVIVIWRTFRGIGVDGTREQR